MTTGIRGAGEFCWINMLTAQPDRAREFYANLLGWTYAEIPGLGHRAQVQGHDIGAIFDLEAPNTPPGTAPHIGVMLKVENADGTGEKAAALGGTARPAFDIGNQGRMAVCHDPNGANFDVLQPYVFHGTEVDSTLHGAPTWFETLTTDVGRAGKFYADLFGWKPEPVAIPGHNYTQFLKDGEPVAGMLEITPHMGSIKPHWATYFAVRDVDACAGEAARLGGKVCVPPTDIPGVGRFAGIISPQGVSFYVMSYKR